MFNCPLIIIVHVQIVCFSNSVDRRKNSINFSRNLRILVDDT